MTSANLSQVPFKCLSSSSSQEEARLPTFSCWLLSLTAVLSVCFTQLTLSLPCTASCSGWLCPWPQGSALSGAQPMVLPWMTVNVLGLDQPRAMSTSSRQPLGTPIQAPPPLFWLLSAVRNSSILRILRLGSSWKKKKGNQPNGRCHCKAPQKGSGPISRLLSLRCCPLVARAGNSNQKASSIAEGLLTVMSFPAGRPGLLQNMTPLGYCFKTPGMFHLTALLVYDAAQLQTSIRSCFRGLQVWSLD